MHRDDPGAEGATPDGIVEHAGEDARQYNADTLRRATEADVAARLAGLPDRVREEGPAAAFEPALLAAAAQQRTVDLRAHVMLREALKRTVRFSASDMRDWRRALDKSDAVRDVHRRRASDASEPATSGDDTAMPRERELHRPEPAEVNGVTYHMAPGHIWSESVAARGRADLSVRDDLASFSAVIVEVVLDVNTPDAPPIVATYTLSVVVAVEGRDRQIEVTAAEWAAMRWPEHALPCPRVAPGGPRTREHLRAAIEHLSRDVRRRYRYRFGGWAPYTGRHIYLHAGGAIDANGEVEGVRAEPAVPRARRFELPRLHELDLQRDVGAIIALLMYEPRSVWIPLVGHAIRAAMGDARATVHLSGRTGLGKSTIIACVAQCFGAGFSATQPLLSWRQRGTTAQGIMETLAVARDVFVPIDDLVQRPEVIEKFVQVIPAHFERASQVKGHRHGGAYSLPPSQGVIGSSGEELPPEPSVRNRVHMLVLDEHPSPHPCDGPGSAAARGARGETARGMAAFIMWWAARIERCRPQLVEMERAAASRWCTDVRGRAADVLGAPALGLETFFDFLADRHVLDANELSSLRARAMDAMRESARIHISHVEDEAHWRRFLTLVAEALFSGRGHAPQIRLFGREVREAPPENYARWGYDTMQMADGSRVPRARGPKIALTHHARQGAVLILPGPALALARELAREQGRDLPVSLDALARELRASKALRCESKGRAIGRSKWSCGSDCDVEGFEVDATTLGLAAPTDTSTAGEQEGEGEVVPLPAREQWCTAWSEAWEERIAIASEGGADDPVAVADDEIRRMMQRGELLASSSAEA